MKKPFGTRKVDFTITRKGVVYVLKTCSGCGDEWYAKPKQNRCSLCGSGLVTRTPENINKEWDQLKPERAREVLADFYLSLLGVK